MGVDVMEEIQSQSVTALGTILVSTVNIGMSAYLILVDRMVYA